MSEENQENAGNTEVEAVEAPEVKVPKPVRIVTMEDGSQVNFGVRANLITSFDTDTGTISFKISTGQIIAWVQTGLEALTEFQKKVYLYGLQERVKSTLAKISNPEELAPAINKQTAAIDAGEFTIRTLGEDSGEVVLTDDQQAFAIVVSRQSPEYAHWANVEDTTVIAEVLNVWETFPRAKKAAIKKDPYVLMELGRIKESKLEGGVVPGLLAM